jgi:hypothetical protein
MITDRATRSKNATKYIHCLLTKMKTEEIGNQQMELRSHKNIKHIMNQPPRDQPKPK